MFIPSAPIISETVSAAAVLILLFAFLAVLLPCFLWKRFFSGNSAAGYKGRIKTAGILLLLMAVLPGPAVLADDANGITLGSGAIATKNKVYFGDVLWRVLYNGADDDELEVTTLGAALLISNNILSDITINGNYDWDIENGNAWEGNNSQQWCRNYYTYWTDDSNKTEIEKNAILVTSVTETNNYQVYYKPAS